MYHSKAILRVCVDGFRFSFRNFKAWIRANNSHIWADQMSGNLSDSITVDRSPSVIEYPLCLFPSSTGRSHLQRAETLWKRNFPEVRSNFSLVIYEIYTVMFHRTHVSTLVKNSAGFRQVSVVRARLSLSNRIASYFSILESVSHLPTFRWRISLPGCGVMTITAPPNVHFLLCSVNITVAATD